MCVMLNIFNFFSLYFVFINGSYGQNIEGSSCRMGSLEGKCQKVRDCPTAVEALAQGRLPNLNICGFDGLHELVCCPDLNIITCHIHPKPDSIDSSSAHPSGSPNNTQRKSDKMCKKFYNDYKIIPSIGGQILDGQNAEPGQFPHMAALGYPDVHEGIEWNCGASLISTKFLLTAAHCIVCAWCVDPIKARFGTIDINDTKSAQDIDVKDAIPHPHYNHSSRHNDIALVELVRDVIMSNHIYPACLYTKDDDPKGLQLAEWGPRANGSQAIMLQFTRIRSIPVNDCNETLAKRFSYTPKIILRSQICSATTSDAYMGKSGGPLMIAKPEGGYDIVGIMSYGMHFGSKLPGIYTRVATYIDWIEENVWQN